MTTSQIFSNAPMFENSQAADAWLEYKGVSVAEMYGNAYMEFCRGVETYLHEDPVDITTFIAGLNASRDYIFSLAVAGQQVPADWREVSDGCNAAIEPLCPQMVRLNEAVARRVN